MWSSSASTCDQANSIRIHRQLYQDVWDWAGQIRTVEIPK